MKKYRVRDDVPEDIKTNLLKYNPITQKLLYHRGIFNEDDAEKFFNPEYERDTTDPFLLKDIEKAALRVIEAIKDNERVVIYSDYDADGIPGAVILHDFFKKVGFNNFTNYIPHRNDEGFGLNIEAIEEFVKDKINLIITIDCGINGVEEVRRARKNGIDVIVTDHHLPGEVLPEAYAIVNPNQPDDFYPHKNICGSAVIFKLVQVILKKDNFGISSGWDKWLLDMVGLATISDMVPLIGENRTLSFYGLVVLRKTKRLGLRKLYEEVRLNVKNLNEDDVSFVLTPRINAASRMDEVYTAFDLLRTENIALAESGAKKLTTLNNQRKVITANIVKEIKKTLSKKVEIPKIIVAGNSKWPPSILGLVAGNLAEEFKKPVFLWGQNGYEEIKGSCRSDKKTDIFSLMQKLPKGFLTHFGGHKFSGGFGISKDNIHFLEDELIKAFISQPQNEHVDEFLVDELLNLHDIEDSLTNDLKKFSPYGAGNDKPVFIFKESLISQVQKFGKNSEHIKLIFKDKNSRNITAISFFSDQNSFSRVAEEGMFVDLVASIEESFFGYRREVRLRIIDII
jgi:single-stranded-DNA-specific exonuclease